MQNGYIYQANGAWHVRYRVDGEQISRKLADYNDQYRTKRSVRPLASEIIDPLNQGREVDGPMTLQPYAETVHFPNVKPQKSPSTLQGQFQPVLQADSAAYRWTQTFDVFDFRHPTHLVPHRRTRGTSELKRHRKANPGTSWVFEGPRVFPLELATLGSKVIKKVLQGTGVEWRGFHAFRRGSVVSLGGCTTTGRQSKPLVRFSVMALGQK
jgi:hypothetical protein